MQLEAGGIAAHTINQYRLFVNHRAPPFPTALMILYAVVSMVGRIDNSEMLARGGSDATNRTASATSLAAIAPSLVTCDCMVLRISGSLTFSKTSVAVAPGLMMQTRMPKPPTSWRIASVIALRPCLLAV